MRRSAIVLLALLFGGALYAQGVPMTLREDVAALLRQSAPASLSGDEAALGELELELSDLDFHCLAVLAPPNAPAEGPLPLVVAMQKSSLRGWEVGDEANLLLAAYDPDSGALRFGRALADPKAEERPAPGLQRPPRPPDSAAHTLMTKAYRFNLRQQLDLPSAQTLVLRAFSFDWVSNGATVAVDGGPRAETVRMVHPMPAGAPGHLPSYEPSPRFPAAPVDGVAFHIETASDGTAALMASFAKLVTPAEVPDAPLQLTTADGLRSAVAVVPVTFAVVVLDQPQPLALHWTVPVYGDAPAAPGERISGQFAIALPPMPSAAQSVGYLFLGEHLAGPCEMPAPR
jgi:hypothetical protein